MGETLSLERMRDHDAKDFDFYRIIPVDDTEKLFKRLMEELTHLRELQNHAEGSE